MYRKEEEKIKSGFDSVAPDLFKEIQKKEYKKIESEEELFGELNLPKTKGEQSGKIIPFYPKAVLGSVAAVILCCLVWMQLFAPKAQATRVMIDLDSSMQFVVTEKEQKVEVAALNEDSEKIAESISKNETLEETVYEIMECLNQNEHFKESDTGMLISYINQEKGQEKKKKVSSVIREYFQKQKLNVTIVQQEVEEKTKLKKEAAQQGISLGKYCFLKSMQEKYQVDAKALYGKDMGEILQEIDQKGIDLSHDAELDYVSGNAKPDESQVSPEEDLEEAEQNGSSQKDEKKKKGKKDQKRTMNSVAASKKKETEKTSNKEKPSNSPENVEKEEEGSDKEIKPQSTPDVETAKPVMTEAPVPMPTPEVKQDVSGTSGNDSVPPEPAVTSTVQPGEAHGKDGKEEKKESHHNKENHSDNQNNNNKNWQLGKNESLDWDVDDMKEHIEEYMKNHNHSKKGYVQAEKETLEEMYGDFLQDERNVKK